MENKNQICPCCMEVHTPKLEEFSTTITFKGVPVTYMTQCYYCEAADESYMTEKQLTQDDIALKNAYRKHMGLLTADDIVGIRRKYGISQSDLCAILGWGEKTITRYESHQVQDKAHDMILRKVDEDPAWVIELLQSADGLSPNAREKYLQNAYVIMERSPDLYLQKSIYAKYSRFEGDDLAHGNTRLSLGKVADTICYIADFTKNLYKVKLMKMLFYADFLSFKRRGYAITGLVYQACQMGALPIAHNLIIDLDGVKYEEKEIRGYTAYQFVPGGNNQYRFLSDDDKKILDDVIGKFGTWSKDRIVKFMHEEEAYLNTPANEVISFQYANALHIE